MVNDTIEKVLTETYIYTYLSMVNAGTIPDNTTATNKKPNTPPKLKGQSISWHLESSCNNAT